MKIRITLIGEAYLDGPQDDATIKQNASDSTGNNYTITWQLPDDYDFSRDWDEQEIDWDSYTVTDSDNNRVNAIII